MGNSDGTSVMEKSKEKATRNWDSDSDSDLDSDKTNIKSSELSSMEAETEAEWWISREKWPTTVKVLDHGWFLFQWILSKWGKMFVTSCVFGVLLDPLFLYLPIIKRDMSCLSWDQNLKATALALRSVSDLFYIMDIIIQIYTSRDLISPISLIYEFHNTSSLLGFLWNTLFTMIPRAICSSYILIDIFAILPLPQVLILMFFSKMGASESANTRKFIMNFFVLTQYIPRVLRIYISCKEPKKPPRGPKRETPIWVKGVLNFFMYILASHVLGGVWYFFSIQRMTVCWQNACRKENGCNSTAFSCDDRAFRNTTFLNDLCPINPPNATLFDFGIFLSILQTDVPVSTKFVQKFTNCFCWGLRNLSSLGSNLQPSTNTWENLFVVLVSIIGLLLFIYLIGNLQIYLSLDTARIETHRHKMKMKRKMEEKDRELELWLPKNGIPERSQKDMKLQIMEKVEQEFEEDRDVDLDNILCILPADLENKIKPCMPLTKLKKVRVLQNMEEKVLRAICHHLTPMKFSRNMLIIPEDEPLKMMVFIVEGVVAIKKKDGSVSQKGDGELYGEKLLSWPLSSSFPHTLPTATESAMAIGEVEALILKADDMKIVAFKFRLHFIKKFGKLKSNLVNDDHRVRPPAVEVETSPGYSPGERPAASAALVMGACVFSAKELKKATNNFHPSGMIGEGGYGIVYKGTLADGRIVAIKKPKSGGMWNQSESFVNEAFVLSQIRHRNLVSLIGCCLETKLPVMVYEFINNGTLHEHIHGRDQKSKPISLELRMKIARDVAGALAYLHFMSIIHRDVKTMNILLDDRYTAKVSDFGAAKFLHEDEDEVTTIVKGTIGYLDPEYCLGEKLTEKSDVYGFGVVLAELLTSRRAISRDRPREEMGLASFFVLASEDRLQQILDAEIINDGNFWVARRVADLANSCLRDKRDDRPSMKEVATQLEHLISLQGINRNHDRDSGSDFSGRTVNGSSNDYVVNIEGGGTADNV